MNRETQPTQTWPDLAIGLYDQLTGRKAEIAYRFEDFEIDVPARAGGGATSARWRVHGTLRVTTRERSEA